VNIDGAKNLDKLEALASSISEKHMVALCETRNTCLDSLVELIDETFGITYKVLYLESEGYLGGSGLAGLIHEDIGNRITVFHRLQKLQALWLKVEGICFRPSG